MRSWVADLLRHAKQQAETACKEAVKRNGYRFAPIAAPRTKSLGIHFSPTRAYIPPDARFTATRTDSPREAQFTAARIDGLPIPTFTSTGMDGLPIPVFTVTGIDRLPIPVFTPTGIGGLSNPPMEEGRIVAPFSDFNVSPSVVTGNLVESRSSISPNLVESHEATASSDYISANNIETDTFTLELLLPSVFVGPNIAPQSPAVLPEITQFEFAFPQTEVRHIPFPEIAVPTIRNLPLPPSTKVSRNLFQPFPPVWVIGRRFEEKQETDNDRAFPESTLVDKPVAVSEPANKRKPPSAPEVTIAWDYLLAFLKPPLRLDRLRPSDLPGTLYPFQIEGVKRLVSNTAFLLADEMGTGKTVMTSVALRLLLQQGRIHRVLVVCPKSILSVWRRHLRDWAKPLSVVVISNGKAARQLGWKAPAHVYVTTYDAARNDLTDGFSLKYSPRHPAAHSGGFDAIVLDEAHAVKNRASRRSKAITAISQETAYNWALTGTPIQNSLKELATLCGILRVPPPGSSGTKYHLAAAQNTLAAACRSIGIPPPPAATGCDAATLWANVPTTSRWDKDLIRDAIEPHFLRRRKQDVFPELPSKLRTDEWLELDPDQHTEYEATLADGRNEFSSRKKEFSRIHVFALLNRLKRICNFAKGKDCSPKTAAALEHIEDIVESGKKVLVFTQYKEEGVHKLKRLFDPFGVEVITGDSSERQRLLAVERFQTDRNRHVFLATPKTAGEGLTLTAASYVIHFDQWWNPAVAWQAEDRAHRKGQTETVNVYSFWMRGTVEQRIHLILRKKGLLHSEIIDSLSETDFDKALTLDDLLSVFDLQRDTVRIR